MFIIILIAIIIIIIYYFFYTKKEKMSAGTVMQLYQKGPQDLYLYGDAYKYTWPYYISPYPWHLLPYPFVWNAPTRVTLPYYGYRPDPYIYYI